jgi:hypothetical protein
VAVWVDLKDKWRVINEEVLGDLGFGYLF